MPGLLLAVGTGLRWLDPAVAVATAAHVLWSGISVVLGSVGGLMDEAVAPDLLALLLVFAAAMLVAVRFFRWDAQPG